MPGYKTYSRIPKIHVIDVEEEGQNLFGRDGAVSVKEFADSVGKDELERLALVRTSPESRNSYLGEVDVPISTARVLGCLEGFDKIGVVFDDIYDISLDLLVPGGASIIYDGFRDALQQAGKNYSYVPLIEHSLFQPVPEAMCSATLMRLRYCGELDEGEYRHTGLCEVSRRATQFFGCLSRLFSPIGQGADDEVLRLLCYDFDVSFALRNVLSPEEREIVESAIDKVYHARAYGNYNKVRYIMDEEILSGNDVYRKLSGLAARVGEIAGIWASLEVTAVDTDGKEAFAAELRDAYDRKKGRFPVKLWRKKGQLAVEALEEVCGIDYAMESYAVGLSVETVLGR